MRSNIREKDMNVNEYNLKVAELEFEQSNTMLNWMGNLAKTLFTTLIMINGGAIISLLTFVGNSKSINRFPDLWILAFGCFSVGVVSVVLAMCFAFFTQKIFREGLDKDIMLGKETDVNIRNKKGINMRNCAIGSTVGSILLFVVGVILAVIALRNSI